MLRSCSRHRSLATLGLLVATAAGAAELPSPPIVPPPEASRDASGLAWQVLEPGTAGEPATRTDYVKVRYTGWKADGTVLDTTERRGLPVLMPMDSALEGWARGVAMMTPGEKRRIWIPEALAFAGRPGKPAGDLVFEITLLDVYRVPPVPPDVAAPPADAEVTKSGLASKVLKPGTGAVHPKKRSRVEVHYTGWKTDGSRIDSSQLRGEPAVFPLDQVIRGWTEGIPLMVEGETRRFWIPEKLAYKGQSGRPQGMLVFDVELLRILD